MIYVKNKAEALKLWPYPHSKPSRVDLPKKYPCLMEYAPAGWGIMGDGYMLRVIDIPKQIQSPTQLECFILGVHAPIRETEAI